jgi:predicted regulator of Ras-like GTPase activity (Roadblock/LC7/MglB family)
MRRADIIASIGASDLEQIDSVLKSFLRETNARCSVLVDRTGRLLAAVGDTAGLDQVSFASLAAADFAASGQLATLLGEQEFSSLYHHSARQSMFLADVAGSAILAVLFDRRTTLGLVRLRSRAAAATLARLFQQIVQHGPSGAVVHMEVGWAEDAASQIDRLFTD